MTKKNLIKTLLLSPAIIAPVSLISATTTNNEEDNSIINSQDVINYLKTNLNTLEITPINEHKFNVLTIFENTNLTKTKINDSKTKIKLNFSHLFRKNLDQINITLSKYFNSKVKQIEYYYMNLTNERTFEFKIYYKQKGQNETIIEGNNIFQPQILNSNIQSQALAIYEKTNVLNFDPKTLTPEEKQILILDMKSRLLKQLDSEFVEVKSQEDNIVEFKFDRPFVFDYYSPLETEHVIINGNEIQARNYHFSFNLNTILGSNPFEASDIELEVKKYNKYGVEIASFIEKWTIDSTIANSTYKFFNWDPENQYDQFQLIHPNLTNINREDILVDGKPVPNEKYDPFINPKTGFKTNLVWIDLPREFNWYQHYQNNLSGFRDISNKVDLSNNVLSDYYQTKNVPFGIQSKFLTKTLFKNTKYQQDLPQGLIADSIVSSGAISFIIPDDIDLVFIYKLNPNSNELGFVPWDATKEVEVIRNTQLNINRSFDKYYFSKEGEYLIATSKLSGESNLTLLSINESSINNDDFTEKFKKPYFSKLWESKVGVWFKKYLLKQKGLSNEKILQLKYFDVLNYYKEFVEFVEQPFGGKTVFLSPGSSLDSNGFDEVGGYVRLPKIPNRIKKLTHYQFLEQKLIVPTNLNLKNLIDQYVNKINEFQQLVLNDATKTEKRFLKNQLRILKSQIDNLTYQQLLLDPSLANSYNANFMVNVFENNTSLNIETIIAKPLLLGENDDYTRYRYSVSFQPINPSFSLKENVLEFELWFVNPFFDQTQPNTLADTIKNDNNALIQNYLSLNSSKIDELTKFTTFETFTNSIIKSKFDNTFFNEMSKQEFDQHDFNLRFNYDRKAKSIELQIDFRLKGTIEFNTIKYPLKLWANNKLFSYLTNNLINISSYRQLDLDQMQEQVLKDIANSFSNPDILLAKDYKIVEFLELKNNLKNLIQKARPFNLTLNALEPWKNETATFRVIDDSEYSSTVFDLSQIEPIVFEINEKLPLAELLDNLKNTIIQALTNQENIKYISIYDFDIQNLILYLKIALFGKRPENNTFEFELKSTKTNYSNSLKIKIINNLQNDVEVDINDVFSFEQIDLDANDLNQLFKQLFTFLKDPINVLNYQVNNDFTIFEIQNLLYYFDLDFIRPSKTKYITSLDKATIISQIRKNLINQATEEQINDVIKAFEKYNNYDYYSQETKQAILDEINNLIYLILENQSLDFEQEKTSIYKLFNGDKQAKYTLFGQKFNPNSKPIELINNSKVSLTLTDLAKQIDKQKEQKIKNSIDNVSNQASKIEEKEKETITKNKEIERKRKILYTIAITISSLFGVSVIGIIIYLKRKNKLKK
ncbi:hypothetical protein GE118_00470 [Mycoplasma sp. NEAQ87857]|uniref:Mbov_0399 family ICE element protein n=1 Tax=Mycoplasma sp. NEAQ87857 TaxID=2683967 RepID=UPI001315C878|nr:hypothetical protein [Mycoplasma sp. NEAQ87857]QGZ97278.1 hypothetical protein GE118_00470 [Mycoplasma sp. NEAQ87857]